ncbi:serine hydrolase [Chromobacterium subtsugae]|uniref:Serine hydrolase n=1 Tax=Chromobacterium subtsugae TaxID=251747 RepID=A0ABS7FH57_9NEIS|nr:MULTISPECIES: serine hydrolase [Chromobacterium]KUM02439.1 peptidase S11 [Chromobacterium subtsugae]KZE87298.1 peptidase S11 [Chromobacterium sp. F49]MBW7568344.1 serine hydrolase [Chromobacterium subtsugae]MBW8289392.1 serine hydrolase [Chromobacterium subtsugae]OBU88046.1 peptidase S11 [Chromobacterium subtsugae]
MIKKIASLLISAALAAPVLAASPQGVMVASEMSGYTAPRLNSHSVLVLNGSTGETLYEKNTHQRMPIASITKLMTAMVLLDSGVSLDDEVTVSDAEIDRLKHTTSRLAVGTTLSRREMLLLALMSSENRAAATLARTALPGGSAAFVQRMNHKARSLGMTETIFHDPTGLDVRNTSTAADLAKMVMAAQKYPLIREFTTTERHQILSARNRVLQYKNSNALVREGDWDIAVQKTGYIQEAGRCMVLQAVVGSQPLVIVLLDAGASSARVNDAKNIKTWLEAHPGSWLAG